MARPSAPDSGPAETGQDRDRAERAEAALRDKSELLAVVTHEMRTPMGAMISLSDLLLATPLDETQRRYITTLQQSARSLLSLLDDVLDNEQLEAGKFPHEPCAVDLSEFLGMVETSLQARASGAGLEAWLERGEDLPAKVMVDPLRLRQILDNLIDNAIKFTREGAVTVTATYEPPQNGSAPGDLRIAVADTGIGMREENRAALFRPYARADEVRRDGVRGAGLGLSIVAKLIAIMGGEISCDSTPGRGTTFTISLPCPLADAVPRQDAESPVRFSLKGAVGDRAARVLVVEDNQINQTLIGAFLETFGMQARMVADGAEALSALAAEPFDVVLMDVRMAGMDGIEATKRIRALDGPAAATPIVALTAQAHPADRDRVFAAGMDGYVSKPIDPRILYEEIAAAVGGRRKQASGDR